MSTSYLNILKKLYDVNKFFKIKLDLQNISKFSQLQGNPHLNVPYIHIAGTNGKGSVALKISKILQNSGFKTGLFTSPHLFTFRERIQINGEMIKMDFISDYLKEAFILAEKNEIPLTYFEYVTMLCFNYFHQEKVDIAVLETGLGGRLDATNIVDPLLSVITSIGFDHCEILGHTLEEIATEKAGIIKNKKPCVIGPFCNPKEVFIKKCLETNSELIIVGPNYQIIDFNEENNDISKSAVSVLKTIDKKYQIISKKAISTGITSKQLCRNYPVPEEIISNLNFTKKPKYIILDVGHNPYAIQKLYFNLSMTHPFIKKNVIYGTSSTKDCYNSLEILAKYCNKIYLIQGKHQRCMDIQKLSETSEKIKNTILDADKMFQKIIQNGYMEATIDKVLQDIEKSQEEEMIIIGGSFFIMRETMDYFKIPYEQDPYELNEII